MMIRQQFRLCAYAVTVVAALASAACSKTEPETPAVATPSLKLSNERAPAGSPLELTYKFVVADNASFDEDYRVFVHVVDTDEERMWDDDHNPPTPTSQWKPGQTIEYTRTIFVPVFPYVGDATIQIGLHSLKDQHRLALTGENVGQHSYKVAHLQLLPQTDNLFTVFKDGWHMAEAASHDSAIEWQWTKKDATLSFKNPKKDATLFLELANPGSVFHDTQNVQITMSGQPVAQFALTPGPQVLKKIPLSAAQMGTVENVDLQISVDKTFVPALIAGSNSKDPRELGVRVFHAFVKPVS